MNTRIQIAAALLAGTLASAGAVLAAGPEGGQQATDPATDPANQPDSSTQPKTDTMPYGSDTTTSPNAAQKPSHPSREKKQGRWHKGSSEMAPSGSTTLPGADNGTGSMKN